MNGTSDQLNQTPQQRVIEIALIFLVFFAAGGAPAPHVNEAHYLAKAKHYWQPDWCAGNLFLESGKAHLTFYWTIGLLTKWFALPTVAWIGRLIAWVALAFSWQYFSRTIVNFPYYSVLSAMLLVTLIDWTNFAGEWVVGGVEGKCFAYALTFWGLAALADGRWHVAWPCFGAAGAFHVLVGGWSAIAAGMVWCCQPRSERPALLSMAPAILLAAVLAMPGIIPALQLTDSATPAQVQAANQIYVFERLAHHLAPLHLPSLELGRKALRFSLLTLGFVCLRLFCYRLSIQSNSDSQSFRPLNLVMQFAIATLMISTCGLAWELITWSIPALSASLLKYYLFRLTDIALPVAASVGILWLSEQLTRQNRRLGYCLLFLAMLLPAAHLLNISWNRYLIPTPPANRHLKNEIAFREACDWIRQHTPADALFLTPRAAQSFKWYAHRSDLVNRKDVPQSVTALLEWRDRLHNVHWHSNEFGEHVLYYSLASQETDRMRQLAQKYPIDFILTDEYPPLLLPKVFSNDDYTVYSTQESPASTK